MGPHALVLLLLAAGARGGLLQLEIAGDTAITETDIRMGGREVLLRLDGDTWVLDFADAAKQIAAAITSTSNVLDEPAGFMANRARVLPVESIVIDNRKNDYSTVAMVLQPYPAYNIQRDEVVYIPVPANATTSGQITFPKGHIGISNFQILAGTSKLQAPALIYEDEVRNGGLQLTMLLINGEQFITRGMQREESVNRMIETVASSLAGAADEPNNFRARRAALLDQLSFDIISTGNEMRITLRPDPGYNFYTDTETVKFTLPPSFLVSGLEPTPVDPLEITVQNSPGSVWLRMPTITELMIREGTASLIIVLKHDRWNLGTPGTPDTAEITARKEALLAAFEGTTAGGIWNARLRTVLDAGSFVLLDPEPNADSEQQLEVRFNTDAEYVLRGIVADTVEFFVPSTALLSRLPPLALTDAGLPAGALSFSVQAMGDVVQSIAPQLTPEHSGDLKGLPNGKALMLLELRLYKDSWAEDTCGSVIQLGFSSDKPDLPNGFMAKLDRLVSPGGLTYTECTPGNTCAMTVRILRESSYSTLNQVNLPAKETVTLTIPPLCVAFGISPSGTASFTLDPHPSEIGYNIITPGSLEKPEVYDVVYENRPFNLEAWYGNTESWKGIRLVNSLSCSQTGVARYPIAADYWGKCGDFTCYTSAKDYPDAYSLRITPPAGVDPNNWMQQGTWSVCVLYLYTATWVRLGAPISVERDPTRPDEVEEVDKGGKLDLLVIVGGVLFLVLLLFGIYQACAVIFRASREEEREMERQAAHTRRESSAPSMGGFRAFNGAESQAPVDEYWETVLQNEEELPDITTGARYAFAEYGEADPRLEFLKEPGMEKRAFLDDLKDHKERLANIGVMDSESDEEYEEVEEVEEDEEVEEGDRAAAEVQIHMD